MHHHSIADTNTKSAIRNERDYFFFFILSFHLCSRSSLLLRVIELNHVHVNRVFICVEQKNSLESFLFFPSIVFSNLCLLNSLIICFVLKYFLSSWLMICKSSYQHFNKFHKTKQNLFNTKEGKENNIQPMVLKLVAAKMKSN